MDDVRLIFKILYEVGHDFIGIIDDLDVLSNDPNNRCLGLRVIKIVQVFADVSEKAFIFIRILPKDVPDDNDSLLHYVWHLSFKSIP